MRRRLLLLGALLCTVAVVTGTAALVPPASARAEEEPIRPKIEHGWKFSQEYDGMVVNDPSSADHEPPTCETVPWCTLVLIEPEFPADFDPENDEWIMESAVAWEDKPVVEGTAQGNDLDIYVYTYEDTLQDDGTYEKEYREVGRSASARQPERMKLFGTTPANPTLYVVVYNFLGTNLGFRIDVEVKVISYDDPDSYLQDAGAAGAGTGAGSGGGAAGGGAGSGAGDGSGTGESSFGAEPFVPTGEFSPGSPSELGPIAPGLTSPGSGGGLLAPSAGFAEGLGDFRDLSEELAAAPGGAGILDRIRNRTVAAPEDVPGAVLVFWLVFAPIAFAVAALVMFLRRRPAALTLSLGAR